MERVSSSWRTRSMAHVGCEADSRRSRGRRKLRWKGRRGGSSNSTVSWTGADDDSSRNEDVRVIGDVLTRPFHVQVQGWKREEGRGPAARVEALKTDGMEACKGAKSTVGAEVGRCVPRPVARRSRGTGTTHAHVPCTHRPIRTFHGEVLPRTSVQAKVCVGVVRPPALERGPFGTSLEIPTKDCEDGPFLGIQGMYQGRTLVHAGGVGHRWTIRCSGHKQSHEHCTKQI